MTSNLKSNNGALSPEERLRSRAFLKPASPDVAMEHAGQEIDLDYDVLRQNRIVSFDKTDRNTFHYDLLRTKVLREMDLHGWTKIAITSPRAAAGKTVTALNLAFAVAQTVTHQAVAIDLDLRSSSLADYLGLPETTPSISDLITGRAGIDDVILKPDFPRLNFVTNNNPVRNASECLGSREVLGLLKGFDDPSRHTITIVDLPPLLEVDDALVVMPHVDCVLLVIPAGQSKTSELLECQRLLEDYNIVGTVLNRSNTTLNDYY